MMGSEENSMGTEETWEQRREREEAEKDARIAAVMRPRPDAVAAAKWWADTVRTPPEADVGDARLNGALSMFGKLGAVHYEPTMIDTFEAELAKSIEVEIADREARNLLYEKEGHSCESMRWEWYITIDVDYNPDLLLSKAAARAGMENYSHFVFPPKTNMRIDRGRIEVSAGYRAPRQVVWVSPEGVKYWSSRYLDDCVAALVKLANGAEGEQGPLATALRYVAARVGEFRPEIKQVPDESVDTGFKSEDVAAALRAQYDVEFVQGQVDVLSLALAMAGLQPAGERVL